MEISINYVYLFCYLSSWLGILLHHQKRRKTFDQGSAIILLYILGAAASLILFNLDPGRYDELKLFPFIYLFTSLLLISFPIIKYDSSKIKKVLRPSGVMLEVFAITYIIFSFATLLNYGPDIFSNISYMMSDTGGGSALYQSALARSQNANDGKIANLPAIISSAMSGVGILVTIYYWNLERRNKLISYGLNTSLVIAVLPSLAAGQRNGLSETALVVGATFLLLKVFISKRKKKTFYFLCGITLIIMAFPFVYITVSRFDLEALESIYFYGGQSNLNFNNYGLDNGGLRYGDRIFNLFKNLAGFDAPSNFWELRHKYSLLSINDEVFIGLVGDFTLDFGPVITVIIFAITAYVVSRASAPANGRFYFYQLIPLHFLVYSCVIGSFKLFPFANYSGNLKLVVYIIAYFAFRFGESWDSQKKFSRKRKETLSSLDVG